MADDRGELLAGFRDESGTRLDRMVETLLAIEAGGPSPGALDSLFRDAHSIKGTASMLGLAGARTIASAIEDALHDARERDSLVDEIADPLLRATDSLRRVIFDTGEIDGSAPAGLVAPPRRQEQGASPDVPHEAPGTGSRGRAPSGAVAGPAPLGPVAGSPASTAAAHARTPARASSRTSADRVDRLLDVVAETVQHTRRLEHLLASAGQEHVRVQEELDRGDVLLDELQDSVIQTRTLPLSSITRAVRDLAIANAMRVELTIEGDETRLDRVILDGISEAISHLLRNAVAHGIEAPDERSRAGKPPYGRLTLSAEQRGSLVAIALADDGRGVAPELLARVENGRTLADLLAQAGLSTTAQVTDVSGRGVGMDCSGARPRSRCAAARSGSSISPTWSARAPPRLPRGRWRSSSTRSAVASLLCDRVIGEQEVVVKSLGALLSAVSGLSRRGDPPRRHDRPDPRSRDRVQGAPGCGQDRGVPEPLPSKVLVVDDQFTVRELQRSILEAAGYRVVSARDGRDAMARLAAEGDVAIVVIDLDMPEMDGIEPLRQVRQDPRRSTLPVVIVSGRAGVEDRRLGADEGADADQRTLLDTVARLLSP